jgi:hypothetical protein
VGRAAMDKRVRRAAVPTVARRVDVPMGRSFGSKAITDRVVSCTERHTM